MNLVEGLVKVFIAGVYTEDLKHMDNGGPECAAYMSTTFRLCINLCVVNIYY